MAISGWHNIPNIRYGFGRKTALMPTALIPYRETMPEKKQVHGIRVVDVTTPNQECGECDALFTHQPNILLTILTADCLPVIFSRQDGKAIAVAHAGWRGLIDGVLEQVARRIAQDDDISQWMAAIGPSAGACCYEVDESLVERFHQALPYESALISPRFRHLDLVAIAQAKLRGLGFADVDNLSECTICTREHQPETTHYFRYTSFRRNAHRREREPEHPGIKGRNQYSGLIILP
ncbi:laccase domain-containing protein [Obesumbacterium proteus]|uniref:polyphenol oxidase family protein n=1 Tax=Obesumbacterium proteus TaxID=82983 RepID=UPI0010334D13|nr:polyphenol oxidase family protein [Obesumbacterium proteus]TBL71803.1 laccase domain-containing protein [Obesumbacterium proteus]